MPIYLVTNKITHARAVTIAGSPRAACELRPDGKAYWRHGRWSAFVTVGEARCAEPLPCWPEDVELVHATEIGERATRNFECGTYGTASVMAFDADPQFRHKGEGPDDSWGVLDPDTETLDMFETETQDDD